MPELDLDAIEARWSTNGGMGNPRGAEDYTDAGCRIFAEHGFRDVPELVARVRELEQQVADVSQAASIIHAHRFDADRRDDPEHTAWLASFGEKPTTRPDIFYAGVEYAVKRIRAAIGAHSVQIDGVKIIACDMYGNTQSDRDLTRCREECAQLKLELAESADAASLQQQIDRQAAALQAIAVHLGIEGEPTVEAIVTRAEQTADGAAAVAAVIAERDALQQRVGQLTEANEALQNVVGGRGGGGGGARREER